MSKLSMGREVRRILLAVTAVLMLLVTGSVQAAEPSPEDFLRGRHEALTAILGQPKSPIREKRVLAAIDEVFDYGELAKRSLGDEWKNRSPDEQKQFQELLEGLVRQSYRKSVDSTLGWGVDYRGKVAKEQGIVVTTVAKHKSDSRKSPVSVDYTLIQVDGKWRVCDVIIEGSSLVSNYRSQFTKIIKKKGFAELLSKMKSKLAKGDG